MAGDVDDRPYEPSARLIDSAVYEPSISSTW
jgi:hypothetical protein